MKAPYSYTGEDVVEIHCHGGALVSRRILDAAVRSGARLAEPGEYTFRAFMNGKMDLTEAEAVTDIISAHSDLALNLAEKQLSGTLGKKINHLKEKILNILSEIESRMDFPEEHLDWTPIEQCIETVNEILISVRELLSTKTKGVIIRDGVKLVIAGRPNVGKSSLLNLLLGQERAIVTPLPGTTRDTLEEFATLRNIPVKMIDTAGIREADDIIEQKGIERSYASIDLANVIFWLMNASENPEEEFKIMLELTKGKKNIIPVWNKIDLSHKDISTIAENNNFLINTPVHVSATSGTGIEKLLDAFEQLVWGAENNSETETAVSTRHASLLEQVEPHLSGAMEEIVTEDWELAAAELRKALYSLNMITGEHVEPDVLENIFSKFCIGK
jgi:tRNA modification GTPase